MIAQIALSCVALLPAEPIRVALDASSEVDVAELVARLADATGVEVPRPKAPVKLPALGLSAPLTRAFLAEALGPDVSVEIGPQGLTVSPDPRLDDPARRLAWRTRLEALADRASKEADRRGRYGFRARESYRPNDPDRPTVCLIHGLNSTSNVFVHMVGPIESAGYGVVTYDFPYNRDLDETTATFSRDWAEFHKKTGDRSRWVVLAHSMGSLLARSYVEDDSAYKGDVASLILIAPPHKGSAIARAQTLLQLVQGFQAIRGRDRRNPLATLGDGLGAAAEDMTPGSAFLTTLNSRPRRSGVAYHTLAGDSGYLDAAGRRRIEVQARAGLFGGLGRAIASGAASGLDELTDGLGDGCVAVASTRLEGTEAPIILHVNHLELIRAPLVFPDPGPVASMPEIKKWLGRDAPIRRQ